MEPWSSTSPAGSIPSDGTGTTRVKRGMAEMLKGGVIMDVVTAEQARIAEDAGAVAVMALERVPADIRAQGGVSRMSDPDMIDSIIAEVSIPVMAKARIGHFAEAQVLQSLGVDYIDESEVLTPADYANHIDKWQYTVPFVCGATNLGEALRRITEGAAMIRSKGEAGTGDVSNAVTHMRTIRAELRRLQGLEPDELYVAAKELQAPYDLVKEVAAAGKLPVVLFTAGGIATPADAAMMMQLGAEGVFVGSGIFKSGNPVQRAEAIVKATTFFDDPDVVAKVSRGPRRGDGRDQRRRDPRAAPALRAWLVAARPPRPGHAGERSDDRRPRAAGRRPRAPADARRARRRARSPSAARAELDACDGLVLSRAASPRRWRGWRAPSSSSSRSASGSAPGCPTLGTCAGMILLADRVARRRPGPGDLRRPRHHRAPQRLRPAGRLLRGRPRLRRPRRPGARRVHPGAVGRGDRSGRGGPCHRPAGDGGG